MVWYLRRLLRRSPSKATSCITHRPELEGARGAVGTGRRNDTVFRDVAVRAGEQPLRETACRRRWSSRTMLAPTNRSVALVVVTEPLLLVALFPLAPTATSRGLTGSIPLYSKIRMSG